MNEKTTQLCLFPPARPFSSRFGREFFRSIPQHPGVYLMQDRAGKIIYVGKAKNLRQRLCSYRYVKPGSASRKTIRLVHTVEEIKWETLASDLEAQLRENYLLRIHRPRFNRVHVYPQAYCFCALRRGNERMELLITRQRLEGCTHFGAFKNSALFAMAALRRLLWGLEYQKFSLGEMPASLVRERMTGNSGFSFPCSFAPEVEHYLNGMDEGLLRNFHFFQNAANATFEQNFIAADLQLLQEFFVNATSRNRKLKSQFGIAQETIAQEELNDFLLKERFAREQPISAQGL